MEKLLDTPGQENAPRPVLLKVFVSGKYLYISEASETT